MILVQYNEIFLPLESLEFTNFPRLIKITFSWFDVPRGLYTTGLVWVESSRLLWNKVESVGENNGLELGRQLMAIIPKWLFCFVLTFEAVDFCQVTDVWLICLLTIHTPTQRSQPIPV